MSSPGRPKKPRAEKRAHIVSFRLTASQMAKLHTDAAAIGLEPNECARVKTTGRAVSARISFGPQAEPPHLFELRQQLVRVGVNMNQIARQLNMTGEHEPDALREASQHLNEILRRLLDSVVLP